MVNPVDEANKSKYYLGNMQGLKINVMKKNYGV